MAALDQQQIEEDAPCCYMGFCPKCMDVEVEEVEDVLEGEALQFTFVSMTAPAEVDALDELESTPKIVLNEGPGGIDEDGAPFVNPDEIPDGHGGMMEFLSTRPLRVGELVTLIWSHTNRESNVQVGLCNSPALLTTDGEPIGGQSMVDLNVFDEHLNLFIPETIAMDGHEYDAEQTHLVDDAVEIARPNTRISIKLQEGNIPMVQFGNLDKEGSERQWLNWCPDGAALNLGEDGNLYPMISLMFENGKAPPIIRNVRQIVL